MIISTNWLIASPGRTGGKLIADILSNFYEITFGFRLQYLGTEQDDQFNRRGHWQVYHSHDPTILTRMGKFGRKILSVRNMVEAALSYCIIDFSHNYHQYKSSGTVITPEKQYLDPERFRHHYEYQVGFYNQTRELIDDDTIVINYNSIMQGAMNVIHAVGIEEYYLYNIREKIMEKSPVKNNWRPQDWISNWDEIQEIINPLEYDPLKILKKGENNE